MNRKRQLKLSAEDESNQSNTVWKVKPPGPEQRELERMFKTNEIGPNCSADMVRKSTPMFQGFTSQVFGNHFRTTKAKLGNCARVSNVSGDAGGNGIPELGVLGGEREKDTPDFGPEDPSLISFLNPPYWVWKYFDHEKDLEFICIAVVALSGIRNVDFDISEDGYTVQIWYTWPAAIYKYNELFKKSKEDNGNPLNMNHPKVHAFVTNCLDNGVTKNSNPKGQIVVRLPEKVQRFPSTYKIEAMDIDGTNIIQVTFSAEPKAAVIESANRSIVFQ